MSGEVITVRSRKYDLTIRRTWTCRFIEQKEKLLTFVGEFDHAIEHPDLGSIRKGTVSYEFYWLDRWYNIFEFREPNGIFRNFYCNVNMPPNFDGKYLDYVDLDIDIVVWPNLEYTILDRDEFEQNAAAYNYPESVIRQAEKSTMDLEAMIANREFPFVR